MKGTEEAEARYRTTKEENPNYARLERCWKNEARS